MLFRSTSDASPVRLAFASVREEIEAAARFARARIEAAHAAGQPVPRIGIVVPDLSRSRSAVSRGLARVFGGRSAFNLSLGEPLAQFPIVAAALNVLACLQGEVAFGTISRLLRSPFLGDSLAEFSAREALDWALARQAPATTTLEGLRRLIRRVREPGRGPRPEACPRLEARLEALASRSREFQGARDAATWARIFSESLSAAGFPGEDRKSTRLNSSH